MTKAVKKENKTSHYSRWHAAATRPQHGAREPSRRATASPARLPSLTKHRRYSQCFVLRFESARE